MSIASLGIVAALAGTPVTQRAAEVERTERQTAEQSREAKAADRAEQAAGIGQTEEDSEASERDADGRRPWEHPAKSKTAADQPAAPADSLPALPKDPSGERGGELDLVG